MHTVKDLFNISLLFWIIMDPLGNVPIFLSYLKHYDVPEQKRIIWREMLIALGVMVAFLFFGQAFFSMLTIKDASLEMAGGIILFLIAIRMVFAAHHAVEQPIVKSDPLIVPLAIPAVAGPGILATITLYAGTHTSKTVVFIAILIAWAFSVPALLLAPFLKRMLGENGLIAIERLFGYCIVLIATKMVLHGLVGTLYP